MNKRERQTQQLERLLELEGEVQALKRNVQVSLRSVEELNADLHVAWDLCDELYDCLVKWGLKEPVLDRYRILRERPKEVTVIVGDVSEAGTHHP